MNVHYLGGGGAAFGPLREKICNRTGLGSILMKITHLRDISAALDSLDIAMLVLDSEDKTIFWNSCFIRNFPEHYGKIHEGEPYAENLRRFYSVRLDEFELVNLNHYISDGIQRHHRQDGIFEFSHRGQWLRVTSLPVAEIGRARIWTRITFNSDTDQLAERMADSGQEPFAESIDQLADGLMVRDATGRIMTVNKRFVELYGLAAAEDILGSSFEELLDAMWGSLPGGEVTRQCWLDNSRFPGAPFEVLLPGGRCLRVRERRALSGRFVSTHVDITDLHRLQQSRMAAQRRAEELADSLRAEIAERKRAEARTISVSRLVSLGEMASGLAHELNQPLAVMSLAANNAASELRKGGADAIPTVLARLERIGQHALRATNVVTHLQVFSRTRDLGQPLQSIDIGAVFGGALTLTGARLRAASIEVEIAVPKDLPPALGDTIQLEHSVLSLLNNAREVLEERRIMRPIIRLAAARRGHEVVLMISDNAGGLTPEILEKALVPFFTTKPAGKGAGLGLPFAFSTVQAMGGHLSLENGDEGAVVSITLPVAVSDETRV